MPIHGRIRNAVRAAAKLRTQRRADTTTLFSTPVAGSDVPRCDADSTWFSKGLLSSGAPGHIRSDNGLEFIAAAMRKYLEAAGAMMCRRS